MEEDQLLEQFHHAYPYFSKDTIEKLAGNGELIDIPKKAVFIRYGKIDKNIGFVVKGLFKGTILDNEDEQTLWFSNEYDILASYMSILEGQTSKLTYTALEDSTVFTMNYDTIRSLAETDLELSSSLIIMLEKLLLESFRRLEKYVLYSPEDRYLKILNEKPEIINRIPQKLLASYIGITPVSLSRLRARLSKK